MKQERIQRQKRAIDSHLFFIETDDDSEDSVELNDHQKDDRV